MIIDENKNGLKGQHNLAQGNSGKPGGALGWKTDIKIVRAIMFFRMAVVISDEKA